MPKSTTLLNFADSRVTNLVMIHIPDHLVSFCNISEISGASGTNTLDRAEPCEKIEASEIRPLSYIV